MKKMSKIPKELIEQVQPWKTALIWASAVLAACILALAVNFNQVSARSSDSDPNGKNSITVEWEDTLKQYVS